MREDDSWRERADAFFSSIELFLDNQLGGFFSDFARDSCIKGCNLRERRSVKIHTCCRH